MARNTWTIVSNHRTGSTVVCQYIGHCQSATNFDEIFHPNAVLYGHGPHGLAIRTCGDPLTYYREALRGNDWVVKAIPVHVLRHPTLGAETILSLLKENTRRWVVLGRNNRFNQFVSFVLMGMVGFHHRSPGPQREWSFKVTATREQYDHFCYLSSHLDGMLKILRDLKIDYDRIYYEEIFSSPKAFSNLSSMLRLGSDLGKGFLRRDGVCQKLAYDHESCLANPEEVRAWIAESEFPSAGADAVRRPSATSRERNLAG